MLLLPASLLIQRPWVEILAPTVLGRNECLVKTQTPLLGPSIMMLTSTALHSNGDLGANEGNLKGHPDMGATRQTTDRRSAHFPLLTGTT